MLWWSLPAIVAWPAASFAQHQTSSFTPIELSHSLPFQIQLKEYDFGNGPLPGLHSYAAGHVDGKWVHIAGRTNGVHEIDQSGERSFPAESQNRDVRVIDPVAKQSWHRSLGSPADAGTNPSSGFSRWYAAKSSSRHRYPCWFSADWSVRNSENLGHNRGGQQKVERVEVWRGLEVGPRDV